MKIHIFDTQQATLPLSLHSSPSPNHKDLLQSSLANQVFSQSKTPKMEENEEEEWSSKLIGRFHTTKQLIPRILNEAIHSEFHLDEENLRIFFISTNLFTLHFKLPEEQKRILDQQPWQIFGLLLVLKEFQDNQNPRYIELSHVPIWFNFRGLYLEHNNQNKIRDIAKSVGTVLWVESKQGLEQEFRARVNVHVLLPLPNGTLFRTNRDGLVWVSIIPEITLLNFCKKCLLFGHVYTECNTQFHHLLPSLSNDEFYHPMIKTEPNCYRSFYQDPDPRFIHSYDLKSSLVDPFVNPSKESKKKSRVFNDAIQFAASLVVNFIEGKGPQPSRTITDEMMKDVVDYLLSATGENLLQRVSSALVKLRDDRASQIDEQRRVLSRLLNRQFAAVGVVLSDSYQVGDSYTQKTIKEESEEYSFEIDKGNSWMVW